MKNRLISQLPLEMDRRTFSVALSTLGVLAALALPGCGSGDSPGSSAGIHRGTILLHVAWPATPSRFIPLAANSIVVKIIQNGNVVASTQPAITRPQTSYQLANIPPGPVTIQATAFASGNGTGTVLALGSAAGTAVAGQTTQAPTITLATTITAITLTIAAPQVVAGKQITVTGTATDASRNMVLVAPSAWQWASTNTGVATVQGSGTDNSAMVTGVRAGTTTITATDAEDPANPVVASLQFTVTAPITGGLQAGSPWPAYHHDYRHTSQGVGSGATGVLKWRFNPQGGLQSSGQSPAIAADGTVYCNDPSGNLYAINPDGTQKWKFAAGEELLTSPAIGADGTIYTAGVNTAVFNGGSHLFAVSADGTLNWRFALTTARNAPIAIGTDGTIYVADFATPSGGNLVAVNPNGTQKWRFNTGRIDESSPAFAPDGTIYISGEDLSVSPGATYLYALNPNGTQKWRTLSITGGNGGWSPAVGADGTIYVGVDGEPTATTFFSGIIAYNPDGSEKWRFDGMAQTTNSTAIGADGTIYFGNGSNGLFAVNPDGSQKWEFNPGGFIALATPAVASDGTVYIGIEGQTVGSDQVYALNPDGTKKWSLAVGVVSNATPSIAADGTVYISTNDQGLAAIK